MTVRFSDQFIRQYRRLPTNLQKKVDRQLKVLATDIHHPGLNVKKMAGYSHVWEARVDYQHRFTFQIVANVIIARKVGSHDILKTP